MIDKIRSNVNYLHISLTEECNLKCIYCKPEELNKHYILEHVELTLDDFKFLIKSFGELGITKVRFTGGEPLLYPRLLELIKFTREECNIDDIGITTNGILLYDMAYKLKECGLNNVNISIDSLKEYKYKSITRGGLLKYVLRSIELCLKLGFEVKINCLTIDGFNDDEIYDFMLMTHYNNIDVRFLELMPVGEALKIYKQGYFNIQKVIDEIDGLIPIESRENDIVKYYKYKGAKGRIGVISSPSYKDCNDIIISSNGNMKLGLFSKEEVDIKGYLQRPMIFRETMREIINR